MRLDFGDLAITDRQIPGGVRAQYRVFAWWDRNLNSLAKALEQKIVRCVAIISTIR